MRSLKYGQRSAAVAAGDAARSGLLRESNSAAFGAAIATTAVCGWTRI